MLILRFYYIKGNFLLSACCICHECLPQLLRVPVAAVANGCKKTFVVCVVLLLSRFYKEKSRHKVLMPKRLRIITFIRMMKFSCKPLVLIFLHGRSGFVRANLQTDSWIFIIFRYSGVSSLSTHFEDCSFSDMKPIPICFAIYKCSSRSI